MLRAIAFAVLLAACTAAKEKEQTPPPGTPMAAPAGALASSYDPSCIKDLACVCDVPEGLRPQFLPTPITLRLRYPWMKEETPVVCN